MQQAGFQRRPAWPTRPRGRVGPEQPHQVEGDEVCRSFACGPGCNGAAPREPVLRSQSPCGKDTKIYQPLRAALAEANKAGIAPFVMRNKRYLTVLRAEDKVLMPQTLHWADDVRDPRQELPELPSNGQGAASSWTWRCSSSMQGRRPRDRRGGGTAGSVGVVPISPGVRRCRPAHPQPAAPPLGVSRRRRSCRRRCCRWCRAPRPRARPGSWFRRRRRRRR
ncbi:Ku protein [Streptomyces griseosporeus]|uniref:Ku protein n=1 Tax=Streptomyces griseosporeus TaxID=1910 RepID=UPI0036CBB15A